MGRGAILDILPSFKSRFSLRCAWTLFLVCLVAGQPLPLMDFFLPDVKVLSQPTQRLSWHFHTPG